jgi:hypothetical protein
MFYISIRILYTRKDRKEMNNSYVICTQALPSKCSPPAVMPLHSAEFATSRRKAKEKQAISSSRIQPRDPMKYVASMYGVTPGRPQWNAYTVGCGVYQPPARVVIFVVQGYLKSESGVVSMERNPLNSTIQKKTFTEGGGASEQV